MIREALLPALEDLDREELALMQALFETEEDMRAGHAAIIEEFERVKRGYGDDE